MADTYAQVKPNRFGKNRATVIEDIKVAEKMANGWCRRRRCSSH